MYMSATAFFVFGPARSSFKISSKCASRFQDVRHSGEVTQNSCAFSKTRSPCLFKLSKTLTFVPLSSCYFSLLVLHSLDPACSALLVLCAVHALIYTSRTQTLHLHKHQAVLISIVVVQHGVPCLPERSLPASRVCAVWGLWHPSMQHNYNNQKNAKHRINHK